MDTVLTAPPPCVEPDAATTIARELFAIAAHTAIDLGSERDRTFGLRDAGGTPVAVLKISNPSEDVEVLDMEAAAALHVEAVDPGLNVALPWRSAVTGRPAPAVPGDDPADLRACWSDGGAGLWTRAYDVLPGASRIDATALSDQALIAWGETTARLARALRGFTHPRAQRTMLWDVQHALHAREMLGDVKDPAQRELVARVLDHFASTAAPVWPQLRAQVIHTDLTVDNTLSDETGRITGIVDFGDMSHSALITDLASVLDSLGTGRLGAEMFRMARLVLDGYGRYTELEVQELQVLGIAWAARSALTIAISSWRVARGLEEPSFAQRFNPQCIAMLETMAEAGWDELPRLLGAPASLRARDLAQRRASVFGPTMEPLFYDVPVTVADAAGVWITDTGGQRHLDAYNNVPCIGHGHPRVTAAISRQSRRINTHMRYLHPDAIELAERLVALGPPELDTVLLVNSGSEANDLAWRIATAVTGRRGAMCTAFAYHGITEATAALSPETWSARAQPPAHVETWEPPDTYRGRHLDGAAFAGALDRLSDRACDPAAVILDGLLTSDGIADLPGSYVQELVARTHAAGGLWIADEVQAGHGRTGEAMWCCDRFDVVPDFITTGKPMGNGHPVAAVITRREIVEQLPGEHTLFSTFGGNPVSAAAALAVLDVLADERVIERVHVTGELLGSELRQLADRHGGVGDVRGVGLAWGIELVQSRRSARPDGARAQALRDRMRHLGVLIGTTGRHGNVLKLRPPLAFTAEHVSILMSALERALSETGAP